MQHHESALSGPANDSFVRRSATDSRINIGIGTTAAQKWDVSVFVLSPEGQCDWDDLARIGATAAPYPVSYTEGTQPHEAGSVCTSVFVILCFKLSA